MAVESAPMKSAAMNNRLRDERSYNTPIGPFRKSLIKRLALKIMPTEANVIPASAAWVGNTVYRVASPIREKAVPSPRGNNTLAGFRTVSWSVDLGFDSELPNIVCRVGKINYPPRRNIIYNTEWI